MSQKNGLRPSSIDNPFGGGEEEDEVGLEMNNVSLDSPVLPSAGPEDDGDIGRALDEETDASIQKVEENGRPESQCSTPVTEDKELPESPGALLRDSMQDNGYHIPASSNSTPSPRSQRSLSPQIPDATSPRPSFNMQNSPRHRANLSFSKPPIPVGQSVIPSLPSSSPTDPSIPFESVALSNTPPLSSSVPLPPTPKSLNGKRGSWGGFGVNNEGQRIAHGSPIVRPTSAPRLDENESEAGPSTPRLQAPPAHPHPYPLPSSPRHESRASTSSNPANTSIPTGGLGVKGISTFEKVVSQTRPSWLPPKPKEEDENHYNQWSEMMSQSKEAEQQRIKKLQVARLEREKRLALLTPQWEALLSSPDFSANKVRTDPVLRKLWFNGIPPRLRGEAWSKVIGNPLQLGKEAYKSYNVRARKAVESGRFPVDVLEKMEVELDETLVTLKMFYRGSPMREELKELICAWIVYRSDEGLGYASYITHLAAMLLLTSPPPTAFIALTNLLSRPCLQAFYTNHQPDIDAYYRVFENLQADSFPKIYANCKNLGIRLPESWFRGMLVEQIPFECACRLWDQIVLDGDGYIFRAALGIFGFLEPRLHYPDHDEILSVLEGHNAATLAITQREKERAKLRGEAYSEDLDGKLSVFGLDEAALFGWLEDDGWKESRFERLVQRELPD